MKVVARFSYEFEIERGAGFPRVFPASENYKVSVNVRVPRE